MNQKPLGVSLNLPIQTYDIDFAGVVSNSYRQNVDVPIRMTPLYFAGRNYS